jgi:hypothetical protein
MLQIYLRLCNTETQIELPSPWPWPMTISINCKRAVYVAIVQISSSSSGRSPIWLCNSIDGIGKFVCRKITCNEVTAGSIRRRKLNFLLSTKLDILQPRHHINYVFRKSNLLVCLKYETVKLLPWP